MNPDLVLHECGHKREMRSVIEYANTYVGTVINDIGHLDILIYMRTVGDDESLNVSIYSSIHRDLLTSTIVTKIMFNVLLSIS